MVSQFRLLASRRLAGLFVAQFLGALNDNLLKNALVIQVAFARSVSDVEIVVTIATALFILPYFLFSATAGELADKFPKMHLVRTLKVWEIGVMGLGAVLFTFNGSIPFGLTILFLSGIQATFFGPVKYGILPELLAEEDLLSGNAVIEAGTFLAILIGTIAGGLLILMPGGTVIVSVTLLVCAVGGWVASLCIPRTPPGAPPLPVKPHNPVQNRQVMRYANKSRAMLWILLGNSWFWFVAVAIVTQFPNYAKDVLGADNQVVTFFLTLNSLGIGAGSLLAGRLLQGRISLTLVPLSALAMALFGGDLWLSDGRPVGDGLMNLTEFLALAQNWRVSFDLFAVAVCGRRLHRAALRADAGEERQRAPLARGCGEQCLERPVYGRRRHRQCGDAEARHHRHRYLPGGCGRQPCGRYRLVAAASSDPPHHIVDQPHNR